MKNWRSHEKTHFDKILKEVLHCIFIFLHPSLHISDYAYLCHLALEVLLTVGYSLTITMSSEGKKISTVDLINEDESYRGGLNCLFVTVAWLLAIASLILCALWASYNAPGKVLSVRSTTISNMFNRNLSRLHYDFAAFLNQPSWSTNPLAWHAILTICGFFVAQVFALTAWNVFPVSSPKSAKIYIAVWSLFGGATLTGGLKAAFDDYNKFNLPVSNC